MEFLSGLWAGIRLFSILTLVSFSGNLSSWQGPIAMSMARESARKATGERANERALALAPIIAEIRASGTNSLYAIGAALMRRGVPTAHGHSFWGATQVRNLVRRLDRLAAGGRLHTK
jgi:hypothetical protein